MLFNSINFNPIKTKMNKSVLTENALKLPKSQKAKKIELMFAIEQEQVKLRFL